MKTTKVYASTNGLVIAHQMNNKRWLSGTITQPEYQHFRRYINHFHKEKESKK